MTAHDIVWAIRRNIDPKTAAAASYMLFMLKNADDIGTGKNKDINSIGVKALDDYTVQFELKGSAGYFPSVVANAIFDPLPKDTIETHGTKWTEPENIVSNGSYKLSRWDKGNQLIIKKNMDFYDAANVQIEEVRYLIIPEASTTLAMYENNEIDILGGKYVPLPEIPRIMNDPILKKDYSIQPELCTYYLAFNNQRAPMDNPLVRKAFNTAIDRQLLAVIGRSIPSMALAPMLALFFGLTLQLVPIARWTTWDSKILPTIALGLGSASLIARLTRASML
ncbi:MAG: hypothetical protein COB67_12415 [SAR324 cluster bacterium]|uniref:Solute-binding protein family 5 domain-containing protein n=1 Tax=SAR324 cluster bacterium TaxID=2024889 RepID=A0A2A4SSJ7_9DELT|nr:MAG: hypothetical protein COB67_12415 [SAR324 cluster bacterium]